jgi:outer membrane protein assembly factor BamB
MQLSPSWRRFGLAVAALLLCMAGGRRVWADDWPHWLGPQQDAVWRETGIMDKFPEGGLPVKWRAAVAGGYAGPAVAGGRVFLTDFVSGADTRVDDGQKRSQFKGQERVLCFNAADGKLLWQHAYDCSYAIAYPCGPRCTPTVGDGKVYTLGAMGNLLCLDAGSGKVLWARDLKKDYGIKAPQWGFAGHPLLDGPRLICLVGGAGSVAVAFDKDTGKELWRALSAREPGYSSPTLIQAGGKRQLVIWHAESINGLEPETGKLYWSVPLELNFGMAIMAPRQLGNYLFAGGVVHKAVLLKLAADRPAAEVAWQGTKNTAVYPINSTPFLEAGYIYGVCQESELRCVKLQTGERLWETLAPTLGERRGRAGTAFLVKNSDRFFLFNETGYLIIAQLSPKGYKEMGRRQLLEPTGLAFGRDVVWSHPAFANHCIYARNDKELICVSLAASPAGN